MNTKLVDLLKSMGQDHLVGLVESIDAANAASLIKELEAIDMETLQRNLNRAKAFKENATMLDQKIKPLPAGVETDSLSDENAELLEGWRKIGLQAISKGEIGILLLAGGMGTRLGANYPKGMYSVGLPSGKTLYQIQGERILRLQRLAAAEAGVDAASVVIPWYIMTSEHTGAQTSDFFAAHNYFGLDKDQIMFFEQSTLPCLTLDGKLLLSKTSQGQVTISRSPNGNGGVYSSLRSTNVLSDLQRRGVRGVHVYGVDNILVRLGDPVFCGMCLAKDADCGNKVCPKSFPEEPVGVLCLCDDKYQVVEYSEITPETARRTNESGTLLFNAGNIANHFLSTDFLARIASHYGDQLIYHLAEKKIPFLDETGTLIKPTKPNGVKLELFVFDVFAFATKEKMAVLQVDRTAEFSPLKNAAGSAKDCPETARAHLLALHQRFLTAAGATVRPGASVEVSPLLSYAGEGLEAVCRDKSFDADETHLE